MPSSYRRAPFERPKITVPDHENNHGKKGFTEWHFANISIDGNRVSPTIPKPCKYSRRTFFNSDKIQISFTSEYFSIQNYPNPGLADAAHIPYSLTSELGWATLKRMGPTAKEMGERTASSTTSAVLPGSFFSFPNQGSNSPVKPDV